MVGKIFRKKMQSASTVLKAVASKSELAFHNIFTATSMLDSFTSQTLNLCHMFKTLNDRGLTDI
jgi:hypothetical protein